MQLGLLNVAADIRGLEAVIVTVIPENLLYDAWSRDGRVRDADETATYFGDLVRVHFGALESIGLQRGDIQITIETGGLIVLLRNIRSNFVVSLVFQDTMPLGLMRLHTDRILQFIAENLPNFSFDEDESDTDDAAGTDEGTGDTHLETIADNEAAEERVFYGYEYARDKEKRLSQAPTSPPLNEEDPHVAQSNEAQADAQTNDETEAEDSPAEEPVFYGYEYARDKEKRLSEQARDKASDITARHDAFPHEESTDATSFGITTDADLFEQAPETSTHTPIADEPIQAMAHGDHLGNPSSKTQQTTADDLPLNEHDSHSSARPTADTMEQPMIHKDGTTPAQNAQTSTPASGLTPEQVFEKRAHMRFESEGGQVHPEPQDTPTAPKKSASEHRLFLAQQENRMTSEGGIARPISEAAEQEIQQAIAKVEAPATKPASASMPQGTAEDSRAELIIRYVTSNTATPQNVQARLAVHSRVPLDTIKEPHTLDAEQTLRLEEAAKAILGVSKLNI